MTENCAIYAKRGHWYRSNRNRCQSSELKIEFYLNNFFLNLIIGIKSWHLSNIRDYRFGFCTLPIYLILKIWKQFITNCIFPLQTGGCAWDGDAKIHFLILDSFRFSLPFTLMHFIAHGSFQAINDKFLFANPANRQWTWRWWWRKHLFIIFCVCLCCVMCAD